MHAALFTLLITVGTADPAYETVQQTAMLPGSPHGSPGETCGGAQAGLQGYHHRSWVGDWFGPMPQTCYQPRFGCYSGSSRTIHRYPAFHGYYYRQPYNYRHYFDYPWHAAPHEPQGYFTYSTVQTVMPTATPGPSPFLLEPTAAPPEPTPVEDVQAVYSPPQ